MFWAWAGLASQSLTFIDRAQASPAPQPLTSIGQADRPNPSLLLASPSFLLANPSHLLARPLTSIGQTPHFY